MLHGGHGRSVPSTVERVGPLLKAGPGLTFGPGRRAAACFGGLPASNRVTE